LSPAHFRAAPRFAAAIRNISRICGKSRKTSQFGQLGAPEFRTKTNE